MVETSLQILYTGSSNQSVSPEMTNYPQMGVVRVTSPIFSFVGFHHVFGIGEAMQFKFGRQTAGCEF